MFKVLKVKIFRDSVKNISFFLVKCLFRQLKRRGRKEKRRRRRLKYCFEEEGAGDDGSVVCCGALNS